MSADDAELERLKQQRMEGLRRRSVDEQAQQKAEAEKQSALRLVLTPEARQRLQNIKMVRPDFADQLELQLIQIAQTGKVQVPISDEQLKVLLEKLTGRKRDISIRRL